VLVVVSFIAIAVALFSLALQSELSRQLADARERLALLEGRVEEEIAKPELPDLLTAEATQPPGKC
jgi:hypothetical protein